jgi:pteridine reductase
MSTPRRVVLITGAARRIGAAIARRLHAEGNDLALHYRGSAGDMQSLVDELEAARAGSTLALQADLAVFDRLPELVAKTVGHFGRLDALVNNASAFYPTPAGNATPAQWEELFAVNARAPFFLAQAAAPHLRAARGAIVNIADVYAERPRADLAVYAASKDALLAVSRGLAVSLAPEVRVNAVSPGAILWPDGGIDPGLQSRLLAQTPLGRIGDPADIAGTVAWLLGDTASYVTGQVIHVDGGRHIT